MITHDEARILAGARADGELDPSRARDLDDHLAACEACSEFSRAIPRLSALASMLPREHAPATLPRRVGAALPGGELTRRPRLAWRIAPALAAALTVSVIATVLGPVPLIRLPRAEAAEALARISTFFVERQIESNFDPDGDAQAPGGGPYLTVERVWFKAPGFVRIERETTSPGRPKRSALVIERPGERYTETGSARTHDSGLLPEPRLPEPLSPTISLIGVDLGPGPVLLGRPTRRVELRFDREMRVAFVDAERFSILGIEESVVLEKQRAEGGTMLSERTVRIEYNQPLDDSLFAVPRVPPNDHGFRNSGLGALLVPPQAEIEGLDLITAGAGPEGRAALFARGALRVLVTVDASFEPAEPSRRVSSRVGSRPAIVVLSLYDLPMVQFQVDGHSVAVSAPLETDELILLASKMYPE